MRISSGLISITLMLFTLSKADLINDTWRIHLPVSLDPLTGRKCSPNRDYSCPIVRNEESTLGHNKIKDSLRKYSIPETEDPAVAGDVEPRTAIKQSVLRSRRDTEIGLQKIPATKNVREARQSSLNSWSTKPVSVEFRHRTPLNKIIYDGDDYPDSVRRSYVPPPDFITANRRSYSENRLSREIPVSRTYDDYEIPIYYPPPRDYHVPLTRFYPSETHRTGRDYRYRRGPGQSYSYDQFVDNDFDYQEMRRATPKPKRIIYYATLPEIVKKPKTNDYSHINPPISPDMSVSRNSADRKYNPETVDDIRQPYPKYPHDSRDYNYHHRRPGLPERFVPYYRDSSHRVQQVDRSAALAAHEENLSNRNFHGNGDQERKARDSQEVPWPVKIETEVSVKENERIPGRKILGQLENYSMTENARAEKDPEESVTNSVRESND